MLFNDPAFLLFLASALLADRLLPARFKNAGLLTASLFFYGFWDWRFVPLLLTCASIDFYAGRLLFKSGDRRFRGAVLLLSLCANLLILAFFKYFNFLAGNANWLFAQAGLHRRVLGMAILLPVGISFYTFQSMSYTIDVYRGDAEPTNSLENYLLFVSFFPHLVAGPIQRASALLPQLERPRSVSREQFMEGLTLAFIGYVKKTLLADNVAPLVDRCFSGYAGLPSSQLLIGLVAFALQIYWDFSGYCDIARGVAKWFGVEITINFDQPYLSRNIREHWSRWNISVAAWFRDYVYIPLGGSRLGIPRTAANLLVTMLFVGLWHGANWTFVLWGGLHGAALAIHRLLRRGPAERTAERFERLRDVPPFVAKCLLTNAFVLLTFIAFRSPDLRSAWGYFVRLVRWSGPLRLPQAAFLAAILAAFLVIDLPMYLTGSHTALLRTPRWFHQTVLVAGGAMIALAMYLGRNSYRPFIYFQF